MDLKSLNPDLVEAVFQRHGAEAISLSDAGDHPVLISGAETPLWPQSRISGLFSATTNLDSLKEDLLRSFGLRALPEHRIEHLVDRPWEREWLEHFKPMRFGNRLWVSPEAFEVDADNAVVVRLDPGMAFGTGTHPSTALCLHWLDGLELSALRILDFGCGSGILAIAGLLLGAESAIAVDTDRQAVESTRENARRNGVEDRLFVTQDVAEVTGEFDIVVANILADLLVEIAGEICERIVPGGLLALSGILEQQAESVIEAYRESIDFEAPEADSSEDQTWIRLAGMRI
jgi:ribosomal protein L11 methyltransferase